MTEAARFTVPPGPAAGHHDDVVARFVVTRRLVGHVVAECTVWIRREMSAPVPDLQLLSRLTAVRAEADRELHALRGVVAPARLDEVRAVYETLLDAIV